MTEEELAHEIRTRLDELNPILRKAAEAGLTVEVSNILQPRWIGQTPHMPDAIHLSAEIKRITVEVL